MKINKPNISKPDINIPKPKKSWLLGAAAVAMIAGGLYTGTYRLGPNEGAYIERIPGMGNQVVVEETRIGFNLPWPLGKNHKIPFYVDAEGLKISDGHAVIEFDLEYEVKDNQREAYVEKYGPMVTHKSLQERMIEAYYEVNEDGFEVRDIINFPRLVVMGPDDYNLDYATSAAVEDLFVPAARQVTLGRSMDEIELLLEDEEYMSSVERDIKILAPMITITELNINGVEPAAGWITSETRDGYHIDLLVRSLNTKMIMQDQHLMSFSSKSPLPNKEVHRIIENVVGEHYLVEFAHSTLPKELEKEFLLALNNELTDTSTVYSDLKLDLSMARAKYFRIPFGPHLLGHYSHAAADYMGWGDTESAVRTLEGLIDYTNAFPLNEELQSGMVETYYTLALLYDPYDGILDPADWQGTDIPTAVDYYFKFYKYAPQSDRKAEVFRYLGNTYPDYFNVTDWEITVPEVTPEEELITEEDLLLEEILPEVPVTEEEETIVEEETTPTPVPEIQETETITETVETETSENTGD